MTQVTESCRTRPHFRVDHFKPDQHQPTRPPARLPRASVFMWDAQMPTSLWPRPQRAGSAPAVPGRFFSTAYRSPSAPESGGAMSHGLTYPTAVALGGAVPGSVNLQELAESFPANLEGGGGPLRQTF